MSKEPTNPHGETQRMTPKGKTANRRRMPRETKPIDIDAAGQRTVRALAQSHNVLVSAHHELSDDVRAIVKTLDTLASTLHRGWMIVMSALFVSLLGMLVLVWTRTDDRFTGQDYSDAIKNHESRPHADALSLREWRGVKSSIDNLRDRVDRLEMMGRGGD